LTTITTFALIALGTRGGLFGTSGEDDAAASAASPDDVAAALQYLAAQEQAASPAPQVVTEYVYLDAPADPPQITYVTRTGGAPAASQTLAPGPTQAAPPTVPAQEPTATLPTEQPTRVPPTVAATPVSPERSVTGEDEFQGTVTAINGEMVTFARQGGAIVVQVGDPGVLDVGMTVKVHAIRVGDTWVAKEIEFGD
jgi:hypothetical protein